MGKNNQNKYKNELTIITTKIRKKINEQKLTIIRFGQMEKKFVWENSI